MNQKDFLKITRTFAEALDAEDYATAAELLDQKCIYESPSGALQGPEVIVDSYRESSAWGNAHLDEIRYESSVTSEAGPSFSILFIDHIRLKENKHTYRCKQLVKLNDDGKIDHIIHEELEGERPALEAFFQRCRLQR